MKRIINYLNLEIESYKKIWLLQKELFDLRMKNQIEDTLILLQHNPVYTLGKSSDKDHLLLNPKTLEMKKIEVFEVDRGGDITYHGPGQIVGYPIIRIDELYLDLHRYLRDLEEVIIKTLSHYNLTGTRDQDYTGVWIDKNKVAAIGVKISRWISMHGFAFNVNTDLSYFDGIIPCGIFHKGVTSLEKELGKKIDLNEVKLHLLDNFKTVFNYDCIETFNSIKGFLNEKSLTQIERILDV